MKSLFEKQRFDQLRQAIVNKSNIIPFRGYG